MKYNFLNKYNFTGKLLAYSILLFLYLHFHSKQKNTAFCSAEILG